LFLIFLFVFSHEEDIPVKGPGLVQGAFAALLRRLQDGSGPLLRVCFRRPHRSGKFLGDESVHFFNISTSESGPKLRCF
jgi:hypothetical protein